MLQKNLSTLDQFIITASRALETLAAQPVAKRDYPGISPDPDTDTFTETQRAHSARYMRVNHVGEICAQALYQSQALTARSDSIRAQMQHSAQEEVDHLAWCERRINELGGRKSRLNPVWYLGSFAIGTMAGIAGDKWNLGFVAETERQVVQHLESHLGSLGKNDPRSAEVITQMKEDENQHAQQAVAAGAHPLPTPISGIMKLASKVMTKTAHWI